MKLRIPLAFVVLSAGAAFAQRDASPSRAGGAADHRPALLELKPDHHVIAPGGELADQVPSFNTAIPLGINRPDGITREPSYHGTPLYGIIRVGNTTKGRYHVVVDHPPGGAWENSRVYVDVNRNGDLTDDGDGDWGARDETRSGTRLGLKSVMLRASYSSGRDDVEIRDAQYSLLLGYAKASADGPMQLTIRRATAQAGELTLAGASHRVLFVENDNDAMYLFNKGDAGRPMWLFIDADGDGKFSDSERHDARGGLSFKDRTFAVRPASDGSKLQLSPFTGPLPDRVAGTAPRQPRLELLPAGTAAPEFAALKPDNSTLRLSDYRGKIVVLDFWATWCGPCIASMPSLEELHRKTADQGVVVLGLCVFDAREKFDGWLKEPRVKTTYQKAFDPAGRNYETENAESIAKKHYHVTAIPTFYVIDRDGRIAASFIGSGEASKRGLHETLRKLGVKL